MNVLGGVETEPIEMKFIDPVAGVGDEELTDRPGVLAVKVDRIAPIVFVALGEIIFGINPQVISVRSEMVVNDVENDRQA